MLLACELVGWHCCGGVGAGRVQVVAAVGVDLLHCVLAAAGGVVGCVVRVCMCVCCWVCVF